MEIAILTEAKVEPVQDSAESDCFASLVHRQSRFVFRIAYSILRDVQDSDDVVQDTFLKIYRTRAWEGIQDERGFLARVAWRIAVDRRPKIRIETPDVELQSHGENPEQAAIAANRNAIVHRLIDALPEELRQPLALSTVEDLRSHEIAAIMGIPEGTVRSRLNRARELLKQKLGKFMAGPYGK
jgi:RNA polymerase sigma-70 factor (ECF subfamily)